MKETMQQHLHTVGQKAIQNVIRHSLPRFILQYLYIVV